MVCKVVAGLVLLLVTLATVAAVIGVWVSHHDANGAWIFGSPDASLALLVFIIGLTVWKKMFHKMCGCGHKGCGCGAGCGCGGMCPACGHDPCTCGK